MAQKIPKAFIDGPLQEFQCQKLSKQNQGFFFETKYLYVTEKYKKKA